VRATGKAVVYVAAGLALGVGAFGLLLAGFIAVPLLLLTPLGVPALLAFRSAVGAFARVEAGLAGALLGTEVSRNRLTSGGRGYWGRAQAVVDDPRFWREQAYLLLRVIVGWPLSVGVLSLLGAGIWWIGLPISYSFVNEDVGITRIDTLQKAILVLPIGVIGVVLALAAARGLAAVWRRSAIPLLEPPSGSGFAARRVRAHLYATALADAVVLIVWAATGAGTFWPGWVIAGTALPLAMHAWVVEARRRRLNPVQLHAGLSVSLGVFEVVVWALAGGGTFWPIWPLLGLAILLGAHAVIAYTRGGLEERIEVLETTRAGAVDVQETELRRIERDLHDGAQARLVALGMSLGMAEQKLAADPEAARDLVTEARVGLEAALRELRDLARGIHPPVLTDRGLEAAIAALVDRSPVPVSVRADVPERPPAPVETAAYFVAAEALANAGKHAGATRIEVRLLRNDRVLVVEVADDGRGGADPSGSGLTGLRRRVEALDGTLTIDSPSGGGTTLHAELPCVS
jgi:signal transduction histidine kinase